MSFKILGSGHMVPERIVYNEELSEYVETSGEWICQRVGVSSRRVCTFETVSDLAYGAAERALMRSGTKPADLDLILCATVSADYVTPSLACLVQMRLGAKCPAMDINAACSGFIYMLETAAGFFAQKSVCRVLVVGAERMSRIVDWTDRNTCVIFGDGAGALVLGAGEDYAASKLCAAGSDTIIRIPHYAGKSPFYENPAEPPYIFMNGRETFKFAVGAMCEDITDVVLKAGLRLCDVTLVVPHQANARIIDAASKKLEIPSERFCKNIDRYGNTSAASIPILLDELYSAGRINSGDVIVLSSFGGGLSSAACVFRIS